MNTDDLKNMIDLYFDFELEKSKESFLFLALAENPEAREYFKQLNTLNSVTTSAVEDFPYELEEKIFSSIKNKKSAASFLYEKGISAASLIAVVILVVALSIVLFFEVRNYHTEINTLSRQIKNQNETIELILNNSMPPAEVKAEYSNQIIIKAKL